MPFNEPPPPFPSQDVVLINPDGTQTDEYRKWLVKLYAWLARLVAAVT
jgi:hypothetical protein